MVKTYSGNYEILTSGVALTFSEHAEFKFEITLPDDSRVNLFLDIKEDNGESDLIKNINENNVHIECRNFGLGAGTIIPMYIAKCDNRNVYFHFSLESVFTSKKVHSLIYTVYIGD